MDWQRNVGICEDAEKVVAYSHSTYFTFDCSADYFCGNESSRAVDLYFILVDALFFSS